MGKAAVLIGVGPSALEIDRMHDFFSALWHWEPQVKSVVLIDDALESRGLDRIFTMPKGVRVHTFLHPRKGVGVGVWGGLTEGIVLGLNWIAQHEEADIVLKTDTDALVIGGFVDKATAFFEANPRVGLIGLYDRECSGAERRPRGWDRAMWKYSLPFAVHPRTPGLKHKVKLQMFGSAGAQRRILRRAHSQGYQWGEHCMGGGYILRFDAVKEMYANGFLDDAAVWRPTLVSEDVLIGAYTAACGWKISGFIETGEVFGMAHKGLPFSPEELVSRDYGIIHSVKNDPRISEEQIRTFFRLQREKA